MDHAKLEDHFDKLQRLPAGKPRVAFFDLDGTLIAGYSIVAMAWESVREGGSRGNLRQSLKLVRELLQQKSSGSGSQYHRVVRRLTKLLAGFSEQTLSDLGEGAYHRLLAKSLYPEAISLVEAHRAAGHHLVMVTAASRYQADPIARVLGIDEICCTQLEVIDGHFTGKVITPMCYGRGKSLAARRIVKRLGTDLEQCWFYTDSSDDLSLLKQVGHPVAVNPSEKLAAFARAKRWPQFTFQSRGMPNMEAMLRTLLTAQTIAATTAAAILGKRFGFSSFSNNNNLTRFLGDVGANLAGLEFEVEGAEHLRQSRPAIFIFNHQSLLDSVVLAHLLRGDIVGFCKQEMAFNPLFGPLLKQIDTIFVDRNDSDQNALLQKSLAVLDSGRSLVIAPEGTRSTLGNIQPFKHGAFLMAKKAQVPIVPIVLHNVKDALPKGGFIIRPATIKITVLDPVYPQQMGSVRQVCHSIESQYCEQLRESSEAALPYLATA